jgi:hypothetical protein
MKRFTIFVAIAVSLAAHAQVGKDLPNSQRILVAKDMVKIRSFQFCAGCSAYAGGTLYNNGSTVPETTLFTGWWELSIQSMTGAAIPNVEYRIYSTTTNFDTGVQTINVPSPAYTQAHPSWTMLNGTHTFIAVLDPNRKLPENDAQRANNTATLTITFNLIDKRTADPAAVGLPPDQMLKARLDDPSGICVMWGPTNSSGTMKVSLHLKPYASTAGATPCKVIAEFFPGVHLGNGWTIDAVVMDDQGGYHDYTVQPTWEVYPQGTSLYGRLNIHFTANTTPHDVTVHIGIKGKRGTQPAYGVLPRTNIGIK